MQSSPSLPSLVLLLLLPCFEATAREWTRFRGPNGSGISPATNIPLKWTVDDYNWQVDLPVKGSSSPVLWGKQIFLMGEDAERAQLSVLCIDANKGRSFGVEIIL